MLDLSQVEALLLKGIQGAFPEVASNSLPFLPKFYPILDENLGHFSTDCLIRLARPLKRSPSEMALKLFEHLPNYLRGSLVESNGYLNLRLSEAIFTLLKELKLVASESGRSFLVSVPEPQRGFAALPYLRLAASACLQSIFLNSIAIDHDFQIGENLHAHSCFDPIEVFRGLWSRALSSALPLGSYSYLLQLIESKQEREAIFCWIYPQAIDGAIFQEFSKNAYKAKSQIHFRMIERYWAFSGEEDLASIRTEELDAAQIFSMLCVLASQLKADEIDINSYAYSERANIVWNLSTSLSRLSLWKPSSDPLLTAPSRISLLNQANSPQNSFVLKALLLDNFYQAGAVRGFVTEFLAALSQVLEGFNFWFNSPQLRQRIEIGELKTVENQILTGVYEALFSIMQRCKIVGINLN